MLGQAENRMYWWTSGVVVILCLLLVSDARAMVSEYGDAAQGVERAVVDADFPWLDAETGELNGPSLPDLQSSWVVDEKNTVPARAIPVTKNTAGTTTSNWGNWNWNWGAGGTGAFGSVFGIILWSLIGLVLLGLVGLLVFAFLKREDREEGSSQESAGQKKKRLMRDHVQHLPFEIEEAEGDFLSAAEKALTNKDSNRAVIYLFADLLVVLEQNELVRLQRGKTNRQYLNDIWDYRELSPYFRNVMTAFEDAFFGRHKISHERAMDCFAGKDKFEAEAQRIRAQRFSQRQLNPPATPLTEVGA